MKVGIYFSGIFQEDGGGYTYEQEIFQSFLSLATTTRHSFTVFSSEVDSNKYNNSGKKIIFVRNPKNSVFLRRLDQLFLSINLPIVNILYFKFLPLQKEIRKNQIEFMIFLNPIHPIVDIPSITPVWDLQHRLQPWFPEISEKGGWERREKYYQKVLGKSSLILTGTSTGQEEISYLYNVPKNRIRINPLPTPSDVLNYHNKKNALDIRKFHIDDDYLLYPAQFWPHKNHVACLQALDILHRQLHRKISLVFVGSDKQNLSYIQDLAAQYDFSEKIHILGFVPRQDLIALYQNAFALLFPTYFGPDNIPPLESFALGCPVIASNVSGADEQLGDAALLIDPRNPLEIARAVDSLYSDRNKRTELIERGYVRAKKWTSDDYIRRVFSMVDEFENVRKCWK